MDTLHCNYPVSSQIDYLSYYNTQRRSTLYRILLK